jgi:hypothetical protein
MGWADLTDVLNDAVVKTFESLATLSGQSVKGTFHAYHNDIDLTEVGISGDQPMFECKQSVATQAGIVFGSTLTIDGQNYKVVSVEPDRQGWVVFRLEEL